MTPSSSHSLWLATTPATHFPSLRGRHRYDAAVVGGGIAGLTAAFELQKRGLRVVVLEKDRIASQETGNTTAHLTEAIDARFRTINSRFGRKGGALAARASRDAIDFIERTARELLIDCSFKRVPGFLYSEEEGELGSLRKELKAAQGAGAGASWADDVPLRFKRTRRLQGIRFSGQAQFHPRKYLLSLAHEFVARGGQIFERSAVREFEDGEPCRLHADHGEVVASEVVVTTNSPASNRLFLITKIAAYRTYAMAVRLRGRIPLGEGLYWDTAEPYHYLRLHDDLLIVGGEDHKVGMTENTDECFDRLESYARERFDLESVAHRWSGQILEPVDGLPYIGLNSGSKHTYVATGFSGNGMTFGTISGLILADLVQGKANPYASLFKATRLKPLAGMAEFVTENKDFPLCLVKDYLGKTGPGAEAGSVAEVAPGEGRIVRVKGRPVAVYRDPEGDVRSVSAVCTHMGCLVRFNASEVSWDCPCHGSRFGVDGRVLTSPAVSPLEPVSVEAESQPRRRRQSA
jgi:glycine/D-amino acid oxidase-like deaminating enzyme/Rieske Fe-S protein